MFFMVSLSFLKGRCTMPQQHPQASQDEKNEQLRQKWVEDRRENDRKLFLRNHPDGKLRPWKPTGVATKTLH